MNVYIRKYPAIGRDGKNDRLMRYYSCNLETVNIA